MIFTSQGMIYNLWFGNGSVAPACFTAQGMIYNLCLSIPLREFHNVATVLQKTESLLPLFGDVVVKKLYFLLLCFK